jgi:hypothetical protein
MGSLDDRVVFALECDLQWALAERNRAEAMAIRLYDDPDRELWDIEVARLSLRVRWLRGELYLTTEGRDPRTSRR